MVSKRVAKRTPTKPTRRSPARPRGNRSPLKDIAASIDRSVRSCRRRLIRVFARLVSLGACAGPSTPASQKSRRRRKQGFLLLKPVVPRDSEDDGDDGDHQDGRLPLSPPVSPEKKTLVLDLDETLVHSRTDPPPERYDFVVRPTIDGIALTFYVAKRPGADQLLAEAARRFEVVVFTAGLREYASLVLDRLDPGRRLISHHLYRDSCREVDGKLTKDLAALGRDLSRVVIVDDNPNSYLLQLENAIPVSPFVDDPADRELWRVMEFFTVADNFEDTRDAVKRFLSGGEEKEEAGDHPERVADKIGSPGSDIFF